LAPQLVRDEHSESLAIWAQSIKMRGPASSWYVYPIDLETGVASGPQEISASILGTLPPPCDVDAPGWVLEGEPPVQPFLELLNGPEDAERPRGVRAQLLADVSGLCLVALTARVDSEGLLRTGEGDGPQASDSRPSSALVVRDSNEIGLRKPYRCPH
jgi:hypothetical protein